MLPVARCVASVIEIWLVCDLCIHFYWAKIRQENGVFDENSFKAVQRWAKNILGNYVRLDENSAEPMFGKKASS